MAQSGGLTTSNELRDILVWTGDSVIMRGGLSVRGLTTRRSG